jgi:hypothetical protein
MNKLNGVLAHVSIRVGEIFILTILKEFGLFENNIASRVIVYCACRQQKTF